PPYWVVLFGSLALWAVMHAVLGVKMVDRPPGPGAVVLNMFYLQKIAGAPQILGVAWTLCIEIQLYLFFALLLWAAQRAGRPAGAPSALTVSLVFLTGALSMVLNDNRLHHAWLTEYWWLFASGVLCYWVVR